MKNTLIILTAAVGLIITAGCSKQAPLTDEQVARLTLAQERLNQAALSGVAIDAAKSNLLVVEDQLGLRFDNKETRVATKK